MATTMAVPEASQNRDENFTGELTVLDSNGDTKIMWDRRNREEVDAARAHFNSLRAKHHLAFRAEGTDGTKGSQIDDFDPNLERIIMVPRSVGG